ncbi:MAG: DegT/DnrJ/EryC1/StrS family aminotransferase [Thermotogota bacterium]
MKTIPLASPDLGEEEKKAVMEVLDSSILSIGPKVEEFEHRIAEYSQRQYAVAVNSGTSALDLIGRSLGIGPGDQYITTSFSFITTANILLYVGATPVFADIETDTFNIDPQSIEELVRKDPSIKGIITVDVFGHPCDWDEINRIAKQYHLTIIEDSCEALGSEYKGKRCGSYGEAGAFAFYPNKQITTGEGGIIVTDNEDIYIKSRSMRNQGRGERGSWLDHIRLGFNYRLNEISSVLGIEQLNKIDKFVQKRFQVADRYKQLLSKIDGVTPPVVKDYVTQMSWFVYVITLDENIDRDLVLKGLREAGIGCRNYFSPIHLQPFYEKRFGFKTGLLPVTEEIGKRTIALPFFNNLDEDDQVYVAETLKRVIESL